MISDFTQRPKAISEVISPIESKRFGISVSRLNIPLQHSITDNEIVKICAESKSDLLILRYPSNRARMSQSLSQMSSKNAFQADTLVYFSIPISSASSSASHSDGPWRFRLCTPSDNSLVMKLADSIFVDYPNHYSSNDSLDLASVREGFVQWATLGLSDLDKSTVLIEDGDGTSVGFALVAINGELAEIELNGIDSDFQGKGAYTALLNWLVYTAANRGAKSLSISTQVQNTRVIRAWIKAGFSFDFALNTFHVMPRKK